jgi:hypothetical protein
MDESLCISLKEKWPHLGNVPQVIKNYFGDILKQNILFCSYPKV